MEKWSGKVAVVTGASGGIGAVITKELVKSGLIVIGIARRDKQIEELKLELPANIQSNLYAFKCDVSVESEIVETFKKIVNKFGGVDVLVNNAGKLNAGMLTDLNNTNSIAEMVNLNLLGLIFCTREAVQSMKQRSAVGHVIHINSVLGHTVPIIPNFPPIFNVYPATKFGLTALTEIYRQELLYTEQKIKVTSISPGFVMSDFANNGMNKYINEYPKYLPLDPEDVASAVIYVLGTPPNVQVLELKLKAIGEPF